VDACDCPMVDTHVRACPCSSRGTVTLAAFIAWVYPTIIESLRRPLVELHRLRQLRLCRAADVSGVQRTHMHTDQARLEHIQLTSGFTSLFEFLARYLSLSQGKIHQALLTCGHRVVYETALHSKDGVTDAISKQSIVSVTHAFELPLQLPFIAARQPATAWLRTLRSTQHAECAHPLCWTSGGWSLTLWHPEIRPAVFNVSLEYAGLGFTSPTMSADEPMTYMIAGAQIIGSDSGGSTPVDLILPASRACVLMLIQRHAVAAMGSTDPSLWRALKSADRCPSVPYLRRAMPVLANQADHRHVCCGHMACP
jgi:hypothetical protein